MTKEEAIYTLRNTAWIGTDSQVQKVEEAINTVELVESNWIPVSERLPKKKGVYTVTNSKGDVVRLIFTGSKSSMEYWKRCAKAWMPIPEPYKVK